MIRKPLQKPAGRVMTCCACRIARACCAALLFLALIAPCRAEQPVVVQLDPSGQWQGLQGVVSLMLAGDALTFSYSAVFGATAHLCDGIGVAGLVKDGEYHYVDDQGTVAFLVDGASVRMRPVAGIPSFCGANWPGDDFSKNGYTPLHTCTVTVPKTFFHRAMRMPPERRKGFVLQGDKVEIVATCIDGGDAWVFARYHGAKRSTVGMLKKDDLECLAY
jgi:hypothetical protein